MCASQVRFIKDTTAILREKYGDAVPDTMDALLELPGVGPKMALILLNVAFGRTAHTRRTSRALAAKPSQLSHGEMGVTRPSRWP